MAGEKSSGKCITVSWDLNPWVFILHFPHSPVPANGQTLISPFPQNFFFQGRNKYCLNSIFDLYYKKLKLVEEIMLTVPEEEQTEGLCFWSNRKNKTNAFVPHIWKTWKWMGPAESWGSRGVNCQHFGVQGRVCLRM